MHATLPLVQREVITSISFKLQCSNELKDSQSQQSAPRVKHTSADDRGHGQKHGLRVSNGIFSGSAESDIHVHHFTSAALLVPTSGFHRCSLLSLVCLAAGLHTDCEPCEGLFACMLHKSAVNGESCVKIDKQRVKTTEEGLDLGCKSCTGRPPASLSFSSSSCYTPSPFQQIIAVLMICKQGNKQPNTCFRRQDPILRKRQAD